MSNNITLINNLYLGPIELWMHLYKSDEIILECQEHYQKKSFRNKCEILCSSGVELLSIPLKKGKHGGINIKEIKIAYDTTWQTQHIKIIKDAYIKAPYYHHYISSLESLYQNQVTYLYDFNLALSKWALSRLRLQPTISESEQFYKVAPPSINDQRALSKVTKENDYSNAPTYPQVYEYKFGFKPNMSILDLIMNQGPESIVYLKQLQQK